MFKRKTVPKEKFPSGVIVKVHPKGWMDESLILEWINEVWNKRPGALLRSNSLLVWDQFRAHLCDQVKQKLHSIRSHQAVIPGGCTSILQPLDVSINKPFKSSIREQWNTWMISGDKTYTKGGSLRKPSLPLVTEWVLTA